MIPHNFKPQRAGRSIRASTINQTLDDVRRLAISQPGPGWGAQGSPGGITTFVNSISDQVANTGDNVLPSSPGGTDPSLKSGTVNLVCPVPNGDGTGTLITDTSTTIQVFNLFGAGIAKNKNLTIRRYGDAWIAIPFGTDIYMCQTPSTAPGAATGSFPYTPTSFTADVYTLDGKPTQVDTAAKIFNNAPVALTASKLTYIKSNGDGTFSVINQVC